MRLNLPSFYSRFTPQSRILFLFRGSGVSELAHSHRRFSDSTLGDYTTFVKALLPIHMIPIICISLAVHIGRVLGEILRILPLMAKVIIVVSSIAIVYGL